jgi:serine/threonine-protein phosphatase 4 catalytic subunit
VAAILELDENLNRFYKKFEAAPPDERGVPAKKSVPDYFL